MKESFSLNFENFKELFSKNFLIVISISLSSAFLADFLKVPLAWMIGPMIVVSIATLNGLKLYMPKLALSFTLIILGLHIGNYIDQSLISQITNWFWTSIIMFAYIIVSIIIVSKYLQRFSNFNQKTSIFSAAPGALGPLLILAEYENSNLSQVATAHLIRLFIIITIFPFIIINFSAFELLDVNKFDYMSQNHFDLLKLICFSLVLIFIFNKIKIPAALLSGTLIASGIFQISEIASYKLPKETINFCLLILGASVGCKFINKTMKEIAKNLFHALIATILLIILGLFAALIANFFVDKDFLTLVLSFCPGGIYEISVIAIAFDLEPEFVAFHHIVRLLFILFLIPVILKLLEKTRSKS